MSAIPFVDKEAGFRAWRDRNPNGFILNTTRVPSANYLILHTAQCKTLAGEPAGGTYWTKEYGKVCSGDRHELEEWAERETGARPRPCPLCLHSQRGPRAPSLSRSNRGS